MDLSKLDLNKTSGLRLDVRTAVSQTRQEKPLKETIFGHNLRQFECFVSKSDAGNFMTGHAPD